MAHGFYQITQNPWEIRHEIFSPIVIFSLPKTMNGLALDFGSHERQKNSMHLEFFCLLMTFNGLDIDLGSVKKKNTKKKKTTTTLLIMTHKTL